VPRYALEFTAVGGTGQAGAVVELLQAFARARSWILVALEVDQVLLLLIGAGGADLVVELLQGEVAITRWCAYIGDAGRRRLGWLGLLVKGLPGSRSGAEPACWRAPNG